MNGKNSESSRLWELILTAIITTAIPLLLAYLLKSPRIGILMVILFLVGMFLFIHFRRVRAASDVPGRTITTYQFSQSIRFIAGVILIIVLVLGNALLIFPNTNQNIQIALGLSPTLSVTPTLTMTPLKPTLMSTHTPIPTTTVTPAPTVTVIPTEIPFINFLFTTGCIPVGWSSLSDSITQKGQDCLDSSKLQMTAIDNGVEAFIAPTDREYLNGIWMPIDESIRSMSFYVTIDEIKNPPVNISINFFFGFIDKEKISSDKSYGDFVIYRSLQYLGQEIWIVSYGQNPGLGGYSQISTFRPGVTQKVFIQFNQLNYTYQIDGMVYPVVKQNLYPNYGRNFVIGFKVPVGGAYHVRIENFRLED